MAEFLFSVAAQGDLCMVGGKGSYYVERGVAGAFTPYKIHNQIVRVGDSNPCVQIDHAGDYRVVWVGEATCCGLPPTTPSFVYTEAGGGAGAADGVVTGMSYTAGVLTLQRSNGLPPLSIIIPAGVMPVVQPDGSYLFHNGVDADVSIPAAFVPSNPASLDALMAAIKLSTYGQTVNNAFGVPQHITIQIPL